MVNIVKPAVVATTMSILFQMQCGKESGGLLCPTCALERVCRLLAAAPSPEGKE